MWEKEALEFVNSVRPHLGAKKTNTILAGKMHSHNQCPVALTITDGTDYRAHVCYDRAWIFDKAGKEVMVLDVPKRAGAFIAEFDLGHLSQYLDIGL